MDLPDDEVHLWEASLDGEDRTLAFYESVLDTAERLRARRFHFERDQRRFIAARGILRMLLGSYVGLDSERLVFDYTRRGKPFLKIPATGVRFNLSHSGGFALFALANGREVGVDVEAGTRLGEDWMGIARRYFSGREQAELESLPADHRRAAFLHGWARKEAYLKATGLGIADGLQKIEVSLDPDKVPVFLSPDVAARWAFGGLWSQLPAAALVYERRSEDKAAPGVRHFTWGQALM